MRRHLYMTSFVSPIIKKARKEEKDIDSYIEGRYERALKNKPKPAAQPDSMLTEWWAQRSINEQDRTD